MDQEVRARIQQTVAEIAAKYKLDELRGKKQEIIDAVRKDVTEFFQGRGITITTVGMFGGFTYEAPKIQEAIDAVFVAQQEKNKEAALLEAMTSNKSRMEAQGTAEANKAREAAKGQADAKLLVAEADAKAIELVVRALKEAQSTPAFLEVKRLEVQRAAIDRWSGALPVYQLGGGAMPFIELPNPGKQ
jgi:regulator of protease activity HflC (stomatin/prohibitin superfamily)